MTIVLHVMWWWLPALIAIVSTFFIASGAGGFVVAMLGWFAALMICLGHFLG